MRRKRRGFRNREQSETEVPQGQVNFDDLLNRELAEPTVIESDVDPSALSTRVDLVPASDRGVERHSRSSADSRPSSELADSTLEENATLRAELLGAPNDFPVTRTPVNTPLEVSASTAVTRDAVHLDRSGQPEHAELSGQSGSGRGVVDLDDVGFWDRFNEATASADLFAVPPAAITVVVGNLDVAVTVAERCQANHWVSQCDVFVLTERQTIEGQPDWQPVRRPSDLVAVLEQGQSDFPLLVIDVPRELPAWVRPLIARLRQGGVGLVHYVLGNDPSDEDLATWHGELGRPAVLDLATPVAPDRVLELLDRGEPVSSVAGMDISSELLLAMRLSV